MNDVSINVLQSGSSGNCLILDDVIALDIGVSIKKITPYIRGLQLVFVGHVHGDHFKESTIRALAYQRPKLRFCGGAWMTQRFIDAGVSKRNIDVLEDGKQYDYGAFRIEPVPLFHNAPNYGLKIYINSKKAIYIVDTGSVAGIEAKDFDYFLLESNHTQEEIDARIASKLAAGEYPYEIEACRNHLSQEQALDWLAENVGPNSKYVFLHRHKDTQNQTINQKERSYD